MCAPAAPAAPDYTSAATAQGAANVDAARVSGRMNNPNIYTPTGSQTVTWGTGSPTFNETAYNQALQQWQNSGQGGSNYGPDGNWTGYSQGTPTGPAPTREQFTTTQGSDQPTITQTLTPAQQQIFDVNQSGQLGLANLGTQAIGRAGGILGQDVSFAGAPSIDQVNTSGLSPVGSGADTRARVRDAMLQRVNTDIARDRDNTASTLIARGIPQGSEAWNREMDRIDRQQTDSRYQAELAAGTAANQEFGQDLSRRQQGLSEEQANQQGSTGARQQAITEIMAQRQTPLNEINAFRSGSQVAPLNFQGYQGSQVAPAPIFGATQAQAGAAQNAYNANVAQSNALTSGLFSLGGAAVGAPVGTFSDRRLKSNVERVGDHPLGIGVYEYDIFGRRERGVMADEVEAVMPSAVMRHHSGYMMVDYSMIGGRP